MSGQPSSKDTIVSKLAEPFAGLKERAGKSCLVKIYPAGIGAGLIELPTSRFVIGRGPDCQLDLPDSAVSRTHAYIEPQGTSFLIADMGSTNGTFVNDEKISKHQLRTADFIRIGSHILKFLSSGHIEAQYHETIYSMMISDGLTGAHNRRFFLDALERELARSVRHKRPLSLVIFDIDRFKLVNDTHGHLAGDAVLREVAGRVLTTIRKDEVFARYGGEEFVVILPEASKEKAAGFAERLRLLTAETPVTVNDIQIAITISAGIAQTSGDREMSAAELIEEADKKLLDAKQSGRNRVHW